MISQHRAAKTVYSFFSCMDQCAIYNRNPNGGPLCLAVTYDANLTVTVDAHAGKITMPVPI
ncbi:hypothetical protein BAUCODRAFT_37846 [Baudoinia panamericana UAMH 10762]|uniref:Uncharacterized protein n=1 Tax=Baudoinia panamericana (strain UAMH 10762) TaxID=717646 RepID=M2N1U8_BAUPA|nr:uncharacterized protein BAUCODRAFT_37846 [Baudoinia panamericana UAMH 10762]EMC92939.1 hypothetical protein BAUCODRAFT_37846 [Baudoinia panamericana UAMH 10762]